MTSPSTDTRCCNQCAQIDMGPGTPPNVNTYVVCGNPSCPCHTEPKEGWAKDKQNLLAAFKKYPKLVGDLLDAAYLAGIDTSQETIAKEVEKEREIQAELYEALQMMWEQYCPPPQTHQYMTAGETCEEVLGRYWYLRPHKLK